MLHKRRQVNKRTVLLYTVRQTGEYVLAATEQLEQNSNVGNIEGSKQLFPLPGAGKHTRLSIRSAL